MEKTENNGQALGTTSSAHSWSRQCQPAQTSSGENSRRKVQNVVADSTAKPLGGSRGDWKLIGSGKGRGKLFLGNLADAEPERKDYAKEKPEIVKRLVKLRNEWQEEVSPR